MIRYLIQSHHNSLPGSLIVMILYLIATNLCLICTILYLIATNLYLIFMIIHIKQTIYDTLHPRIFTSKKEIYLHFIYEVLPQINIYSYLSHRILYLKYTNIYTSYAEFFTSNARLSMSKRHDLLLRIYDSLRQSFSTL